MTRVWKFGLTEEPQRMGRIIQAIVLSNPIGVEFVLRREGDEIVIRPRGHDHDSEDD
jgi:hypothetical protein